MYFRLNMGIFHCYVSLPEGTTYCKLNTQQDFVIVNVGKLIVVYLLLTDSRKKIASTDSNCNSSNKTSSCSQSQQVSLTMIDAKLNGFDS